jgi:hypothetical protein
MWHRRAGGGHGQAQVTAQRVGLVERHQLDGFAAPFELHHVAEDEDVEPVLHRAPPEPKESSIEAMTRAAAEELARSRSSSASSS